MIICELCKKEFETCKGLTAHLWQKHRNEITLKKYYDRYFKKKNEGICKNSKCKTNKKTTYKDLIRGYDDLCNSCKKSHSIDMYIYRYGIEEGTIRYNEKCKKSSSKNMIIKKYGLEKGLEIWNEINSRRGITKEQYIEKYGEEKFNVLHQKLSNAANKLNNILMKDKKRHPRWKEYWLKLGFNEKEAIQKVSDFHKYNSFTLKNCIRRHGKIKGIEIFRNRQMNWQNTLNSKPEEERKRISKSKGRSLNFFIKKYKNIDTARNKYAQFWGWNNWKDRELNRFGEYDSNFYNNQLRKRIWKEQKYKCAICDKDVGSGKFNLHHIDYNKKNSIRENLMWLCNSCHGKTNIFKNRSYYSKKCNHINEHILDKKIITWEKLF